MGNTALYCIKDAIVSIVKEEFSCTDIRYPRPSGRQPCHCSSSFLAPVWSPTSSTVSTASKENVGMKKLVKVTK